MIIKEIKASDNTTLELIIKDIIKEFNLPLTGSTCKDSEISNLFESFKPDNGSYLLIEENGDVLDGVGIGPLQGADDRICEFQKMYLSPQLHGKGYGKILLDKCLENEGQLGNKLFYLELGAELKMAIQLYAKFGFKRLKAFIGDNGHTAYGVWMTKNM
jgi:putative acetyltransferase